MQGAAIRVRGQVQGVGFRPFVWQLAGRFGITGTVLNDPEGVLIHAAGDRLDAFVAAIAAEAPPLARVDSVETAPFRFDLAPTDFRIAESTGHGAETRVTPDAATCAACIEDIHGADPRRAGYAFTNCTHCGPRFTILKGLPYDRAQTSMAPFEMCADCAAEYADPADRRFHAQPVACAACGPRLWLETAEDLPAGDAMAQAAGLIRAGRILAVKGLGGFHLCCDATNADAVALLRQRKRRPTKPLALMDRLENIPRYATLSAAEASRLQDPAAPILLLARKGDVLPGSLAPGVDRLGVMLPYTPLHHLLLQAVDRPLVMTSGNLSGEPQVIGNDEARSKLSGIVDAWVMHDREIMRRLDDSVERITPQGLMVLRHARGRVPGTLPLPEGFAEAPQVVAFGAHLKSSICLLKNGQALLSHHLGDLDEALTWDEFLKADADYADLFDHAPALFACDLHPGYRSSQHAAARAGQAPLIEVQHHHAHLAACLGENGWARDAGPVAGIILDGLGLGPDGTIWGGELLLGDYRGYRRAAWLDPAPLVGGDAAQREPWRNAVMRLDRAGLEDLAEVLFPDCPVGLIRQAAAAGMNAVPSSSAGRLFDAVAACLGLSSRRQSFEGEAAMALEALAAKAPEDFSAPYPFADDDGVISPAPMFAALAADRRAGLDPARVAARFHAGLAEVFAGAARALVESGQAGAVALSGGCFQNAVLLDLVVRKLDGVPVLAHHHVPANDGGLALGQALVAAASHRP
ncbi:carbamoyltransferase HypF [Frigidibacter sp. ROC022]|uniref:carbamoyltransferase HypF n=1 Tax=Frigidibacter sp. ROC022 TaxID=2971796 RepID=UPI00215B714D|nr:carbamoyltransferase HypF [Frigidibacter sp. ROC022]MCR8723098.1 carbamoyltransferase HypF [Frigidibacter sp. ROC022]